MIVIESFDHINLPALDLQKSIEFYTMFFDFEQVSLTEKDAIVAFDSLNIRLVKTDSNKATSLPLMSFILDVDDFTEALQEIEENNIQIVSGPFEIPGGEAVHIQDPGGNLIELYYKE